MPSLCWLRFYVALCAIAVDVPALDTLCLAACCGFDLWHKYILYLYLSLYLFDKAARSCALLQSSQRYALIGAPAGYAGYSEGGGSLTAALTRAPDAVVLLDEAEKAHRDVFTCLLAAFDTGVFRVRARVTPRSSGAMRKASVQNVQGTAVPCAGATFILTSNLGAAEVSGALRAEVAAMPAAAAQTRLQEVRGIGHPAGAVPVWLQ